jgi:hypothetical protein
VRPAAERPIAHIHHRVPLAASNGALGHHCS